MTIETKRDSVAAADDAAPRITTPAGFEAIAVLARRRLIVLTLNVVTWLALVAWMASILKIGGWTWLEVLVLACFAIGTPWSVLGFWNAVIGIIMLHARRGGVAEVAPFCAAGDLSRPLSVNTAVLMTLRNEDPARAVLRLKTVKSSLEATGEGDRFRYFLLSDSDRPDIVAAEERLAAALAADGRVVYRRRAANTGFKAGNIHEFCDTYGRDFDLILPLDADSLMTGRAIIRLARIMQAYPRLGILQSLVVGLPSAAPFARIFQFGMRLGMRTYTMGQAWWTADCGPFWGHNALLRTRPFAEFCKLPILPGAPPLGGHILSHDQVEATLMRRAGYEVRVVPIEDGSFEDNPPDALEFIHRDVRWCQGNMQYLKLLATPGLQPVSRFQLVWAILMFAGVPAWTLMIAALPLLTLDAQAASDFPVASAAALYVTFLVMFLAPKIAGHLDVALTKGEVARFGGPSRYTLSAALELIFSFLQGAITSIRTSLFMAGLPFGYSIVWSGQKRDAHGVAWGAALKALWPQLVFGIVICGALLIISPTVLLWSLPLTAGYVLAVPFAVLTANPAIGRWMQKRGIAAIPEDFAPPPEVLAITRERED